MENSNNEKILKSVNENKKLQNVSDREMLSVIKEEKNFPIAFSRQVKLSTLVNYYNKYWNNDFTDDSDTSSD